MKKKKTFIYVVVGYLCVAVLVSISINRVEQLERREDMRIYQREVACNLS